MGERRWVLGRHREQPESGWFMVENDVRLDAAEYVDVMPVEDHQALRDSIAEEIEAAKKRALDAADPQVTAAHYYAADRLQALLSQSGSLSSPEEKNSPATNSQGGGAG